MSSLVSCLLISIALGSWESRVLAILAGMQYPTLIFCIRYTFNFALGEAIYPALSSILQELKPCSTMRRFCGGPIGMVWGCEGTYNKASQFTNAISISTSPYHNESNSTEKFLQHTVSFATNSHTPDHNHRPSLLSMSASRAELVTKHVTSTVSSIQRSNCYAWNT